MVHQNVSSKWFIKMVYQDRSTSTDKNVTLEMNPIAFRKLEHRK